MVTLTRPSPLSESWLSEALTDLALPRPRIERIAATLTRRYRERWRHYHTLDHVAAMFTLARRHKTEIADPTAFGLAVWYHDAIYRPKRGDNERRSAALLVAECGPGRDWGGADLAALPAAVTTASRLVLATADHVAPADLVDGPLFLDIDLAILGAPAAAYRAYAEAIRAEFRWVPGAIYRARRAAVLARFLERPAIYHTPAFHRHEAQARRNLEAEIAQLLG